MAAAKQFSYASSPTSLVPRLVDLPESQSRVTVSNRRHHPALPSPCFSQPSQKGASKSRLPGLQEDAFERFESLDLKFSSGKCHWPFLAYAFILSTVEKMAKPGTDKRMVIKSLRKPECCRYHPRLCESRLRRQTSTQSEPI